MTLKNKKLKAPFPAKFIFLVHDTRYQYLGEDSLNSEPFSVEVSVQKITEVSSSSRRRLSGLHRQLAATGKFSINPTQSWKDSLTNDASTQAGTRSSLSQSYGTLIIYANIGATILLAAIMFVLNVRWCTKCMQNKIDLNDIVKKFERDGA